MDHEKLVQGEVLFLSDSFKHRLGKLEPFPKKERELISGVYPEKAQFSAAVKCPAVKDGDMTPADMKLCRNHLEATIDKVKPRLVYVCGNLAMKMLIKKSGITNKRGNSYVFESNAGHSCVVVPIYHPYAVLKEPRHRYLFETDIKNAYEKYVLGKTNKGNFTYSTATEIHEVESIADKLKHTSLTTRIVPSKKESLIEIRFGLSSVPS